MGLPAGQLARSSYDFNGQAVPIRSLTRKECFQIKDLGDDLDGCEVHLLACGTDSSREEVEKFRASEGDSEAINGLIEAIAVLSGLKAKTENGADPKES